MVTFAVGIFLLFTNAVCDLADGPGVCKSRSIVKQHGRRQTVKKYCCEGYTEVNGTCVGKYATPCCVVLSDIAWKITDCPECTSMKCPENFCGDTCIHMCDCPKHAYCDRLHCCVCEPGSRGVFCNETCTHGLYGPGCTNKCKCQKLEKCDPVTGTCISIASTKYPPNTTFNENLNNAVSIESNLSPDGIGDTSGNQPQVTEDFKFIVIAGMIGGIPIIIIINILCKISWSKDRTEQHSVEDGPNTCSETAGHYVEINPNDEINQEELERLQEPFNLHPSNTNDVIQKLQSVQCNAYFKATHFTDTTAMSHLDGGCKMHKHFSLPNLSNNKKHEVRNIVVKKLKSQSCDHLKHNSLSISDDDYLNPYCSLIRSGLIESDYLNPYTTLVNAFEKGINSID